MKKRHSPIPTFFLKLLQEISNSGIHFVFPRFCLLCRSTLIEHSQLICDSCWELLPEADDSATITSQISSQLHEDCYFKSAFSLWKFSSQTQTIIHYLKYMEFKRLADNIGYFMSLKLKRLNFPENDTIIIPIPLHKTRERERGYNQSSLICQSFVKGTDFQCLDKCVIRTRYTKTQTKLSAMDRHKNVSGAFKVVDPVKLKNKVVLLIDDVLTTGATMNGCAKELNRFGVKEIHLFSAVKA